MQVINQKEKKISLAFIFKVINEKQSSNEATNPGGAQWVDLFCK